MQRDGGPGGAGGAGNPTGGSFTGPAESLEIYGDFAAAYSGVHTIASAGAFKTMLNFKTGNFLFVGTISWCGDAASSADFYTKIFLNGTVIWSAAYIDAGNASSDQPLPIIIPAYTEVVAQLTSDVTEDVSMVMSGRIYRG